MKYGFIYGEYKNSSNEAIKLFNIGRSSSNCVAKNQHENRKKREADKEIKISFLDQMQI